MKGTIVATWINTNRKLYGNEIVDQAMKHIGWNSKKIFSPIENVEDNKVKSLIEYIAKTQNIEVAELWKRIGKDNIKAFSKDYPSFFKKENAYNFLKSMYDIHVVMTKKFAGAKPPLLNIETISSNEAIFSYTSNRGCLIIF